MAKFFKSIFYDYLFSYTSLEELDPNYFLTEFENCFGYTMYDGDEYF